MKRYWLFGDVAYYPSGGLWDFIKDFDRLSEIHKHIKSMQKRRPSMLDWWHILDTQDLSVVEVKGYSCYGKEGKGIGIPFKLPWKKGSVESDF